LLDYLFRLPGFDLVEFTRAQGSTNNATFRCWHGQPGQGLAALPPTAPIEPDAAQ
jgi:hypothetical protein